MPNYQNTVSFQAPTDYTAEAQEIARRRKYAEALQAQSQEPLQGQMAGGWYVAPSWTQGANKIAQALTGSYFERKSAEDEKKLAERATADRQQVMARALALGQGSPDLASDPSKINLASLNTGTIADAVPDLQVQNTAKPTTPQQRNLAIANLLAASNHPDLRANGEKLMIEALTKENSSVNPMLAKVSPKDYTSESFAKFMTSGNPADLRAREKVVADRLGDKIQYRGEYSTNPMGTAAMGVSPDTTARLDNTNYWNRNLTANQQFQGGIDLSRLANQGIETQFNTGSGVFRPMTIPQQFAPPQSPPNAPQAPVAPVPSRPIPPAVNQPRPQMQTPQGGNLPPRMAAELALAGAKQNQEMDNKRTFNMGGLNPSLDEAERILKGEATGKKPTSSSVGSIVDSVGSVFGVAPDGAAEADKLKSIGGALVAKMPRMEGPQSDKDVMLYREMAGRIGDDTIPIVRRLSALQTVRDLYAKYDKQNPQIGIAGAPPLNGITERRAQPRGNRVVVDY